MQKKIENPRTLKSKIVKGIPAKGFLLENVEGLVNYDGGNTLKVMITHLKAMGYDVEYKLMDSRYFGLAQSRKRLPVKMHGLMGKEETIPIKTLISEYEECIGVYPPLDAKLEKMLY